MRMLIWCGMYHHYDYMWMFFLSLLYGSVCPSSSYRIYRMPYLVRSWMCLLLLLCVCHHSAVTIPGAYGATVFSYKFTFQEKSANALFMRAFEPGYANGSIYCCALAFCISFVRTVCGTPNALVQFNISKQRFCLMNDVTQNLYWNFTMAFPSTFHIHNWCRHS